MFVIDISILHPLLGRLGRVLGASWAVLGHFGGPKSAHTEGCRIRGLSYIPSWAVLDASWGRPGPSWGVLAAQKAGTPSGVGSEILPTPPLGASWTRFGGVLGRLGASWLPKKCAHRGVSAGSPRTRAHCGSASGQCKHPLRDPVCDH